MGFLDVVTKPKLASQIQQADWSHRGASNRGGVDGTGVQGAVAFQRLQIQAALFPLGLVIVRFSQTPSRHSPAPRGRLGTGIRSLQTKRGGRRPVHQRLARRRHPERLGRTKRTRELPRVGWSEGGAAPHAETGPHLLQRLPGNELVASSGRAASAWGSGVRGPAGAAGSASGRGRRPVHGRRPGGVDQEEPEGGGSGGAPGHPRRAPGAKGGIDKEQSVVLITRYSHCGCTSSGGVRASGPARARGADRRAHDAAEARRLGAVLLRVRRDQRRGGEKVESILST